MKSTAKLCPEPCLTPHGVLKLDVASWQSTASTESGETAAAVASLVTKFEKSVADGLTFVTSQKCDFKLSSSLSFWRDFARGYFRSLCRQGVPDTQWVSPDVPDESTLGELCQSAPPMRGLEYLTVNVLANLWDELDAFTRQKAMARKTGLPGYLRNLHSDWNLVGRVTFHLAENKKNADRPFAFMATYTPDKTSNTGSASQVRHSPLSTALRESLDSADRRRLDTLLEPVSRAAKSVPLIAELLESRALFSPQAWDLSLAYRFLQSVPQLESSGVIVRVPNWWNASRPPRPRVDVRVGSKSQSQLSDGGLDLQVNVSIDGEPLNAEEREQLADARQGLTFLRGKWVQVDQERLQSALDHWTSLQAQHLNGVGFLEGMRMLAGTSIGSEEVSDEVARWSRLQAGPWLEEMLNELRDPDGQVSDVATDRLNATLRPYQSVGARWLWMATRLGLGVCLADDMGLGKTIQVITLLLQIQQEEHSKARRKSKRLGKPQTPSPSLLILPTSLLGNWQREIETFAPDLKLKILHRSAMDAESFRKIADDPSNELKGVDVVATTYGLARREKWLADVHWRMVILDEAQAIKNAGAAQTKAIKAIPGGGRIAMTGTPVENHLGDLWSLFDFCQPGLLGTAAEFHKFAKADDSRALSQRLTALRRLTGPYILRRMKTDPRIISDLPAKTEMRVDCGLTQPQATLYRTITDELAEALDASEGIQRRGMVLAALMQLKQICNHPALYLKQDDFAAKQSAKFKELDSICRTLIEKQEKLLVFTQFQSMCEPLADFLADVFNQPGLILTGKTATKKRSHLVKQFQDDNGPPFFIISLKAGGTGLNLTAANHVVHFDRWWNPATEDQATDRAFRIGQKRNVIVHKFVCRGTLEERIDDMICSKREVSRELFGDDGQVQLTEMSNEQLMSFITLDLAKATTV